MKQTALLTIVLATLGLVSAAPTAGNSAPAPSPEDGINKDILFTRTPDDAPSSPLSPLLLAKRATHTPGGRNDYCGEAVPQYSTNPNSPLATDCRNIPNLSPANVSGYWTISQAESTGFNWITLGQSGTCKFRVRLLNGYGQTPRKFVFGTNDLRFYVNAHTYTNVDSAGRVEVASGVYCNDGTATGTVYLDWSIAKV